MQNSAEVRNELSEYLRRAGATQALGFCRATDIAAQEMVRFSQCLSMTPLVHAGVNISHRSFAPTRMLQLRRLLLATVVTTAACASGPEIRKLGDYGSLQPLFTTPHDQKTPSEITVNLNHPAYVTALFVVPGRGAVILYPTDTSMDTHVDAGQHTIPVRFRERAFNRDSMYAALRRQSQGRGNPPPAPQPTSPVFRDTTHRDSTRFGSDSSATPSRGIRDPGPGASPIGYLLLVASPSQIPLTSLQRRVNGVTIPIDDDEALSTVMKLVKSTLPDGTNLAGYARELDRT
jgi:hypothetical protein